MRDRDACASESETDRASHRAAAARRERNADRVPCRMRTRMRRTPRPLLLVPRVEPLPRFPPQLSLRDHVAEELRRLETRAEGLGEVFGDAQSHVEADQVGEAQWAH